MATIFTRIINGELPGRFVYRDDRVVAFLSIQPMSLGHTLIVPIAEVDHWLDCDPDLWQHLNAVAQRVGRAVHPVAGTQRVATLVAGFEVPHLHLHVFGADDMSGFQLSEAAAKHFDDAELDRAQAEIAAALGEENLH